MNKWMHISFLYHVRCDPVEMTETIHKILNVNRELFPGLETIPLGRRQKRRT